MVTGSVLILFALVFLGFYIGKREIVRREAITDLTNLVLKVTLPVTIFCSLARPINQRLMAAGWQLVIALLAYHGLAFLLGIISAKLLRVRGSERGVWLFSCMLSNNGFMGFPLALAIYGEDGLFLMTLANIILNLFIFSAGIKLLTASRQGREAISWRRALLNNVNLAVVPGLVFYFAQIPLSPQIAELLSYLSNITSGMSMLIIGLSLSRMPLREVLADKKMLALAAVRLVVIPLVTIGAVRLLPVGISREVMEILVLAAVLPASSAQTMLCEQYGVDPAASNRAVMVTTLLCLVTVPLMLKIKIF